MNVNQPTTDLISARDLLEAVKDSGHQVSLTQLARWHRSGLLPVPTRQFRGRGKGSESAYSNEAVRYVHAICELQKKTRQTTKVRWALWWHGFEVAPKYWKPQLEKSAAFWDKTISKLRKCEAGKWVLKENIYSILSDLSESNEQASLFLQLRKRIRKENVERFMNIALTVSIGGFNGFEDYWDASEELPNADRDLVSKAFGLHTASLESRGKGQWFDPASIEPTLKMISLRMQTPLAEVIGLATDDDIIQARRELSSLLQFLYFAGSQIEANHGKHALGLSVIKDIAEKQDAHSQSILLLLWLSLRREPQMAIGMTALLGAIPGIIAQAQINHAL